MPASTSNVSTPLWVLERVESALDRVFESKNNPLRQLGALGYWLFWLICATGAYLFLVYDTSVGGAYRSVHALVHEQWWLGGIVRSVHRYASDAFIAVIVLHLAREGIMGRFRRARWFTWISGIALPVLGWATGLAGFWMVWDEMGAFSAVASMEWFDALNVFAEPLPRNFLNNARVDDRLFSLFIFLHIGLSLVLLLGMWLHVLRLALPGTRPTRPVAVSVTVVLLAMSILQPASLGNAADLSRVPTGMALDWFYLSPHVVQYATSPMVLWMLALALIVLLVALPWLPTRKVLEPVAVVDANNCNGCGRCFADCPYDAVSMLVTPGRGGGGRLAVVDPELCASCGICAGACPSATPFRSVDELVSGIDMPRLPIQAIRAKLKAALDGTPKIVIFGCERGASVEALEATDTVTLSLMCAGQLPPAFVEYAVRSGAQGVIVSSCHETACEFRLGERWTQQRLNGQRDPYLRKSVDPARWQLISAGRFDLNTVARARQEMREKWAQTRSTHIAAAEDTLN